MFLERAATNRFHWQNLARLGIYFIRLMLAPDFEGSYPCKPETACFQITKLLKGHREAPIRK